MWRHCVQICFLGSQDGGVIEECPSLSLVRFRRSRLYAGCHNLGSIKFQVWPAQ